MPQAYQHRPLSSILAPTPAPKDEGSNTDQPRDPSTGQFVSPEPQQQEVANELPEKYQGKTAAEIAEMHMNAEKELGRVRNEVGTYRGLVNDLTALQRKPTEPQTVSQEKIDVSGDELLTDPAGAIDKVVTRRLSERDAADAARRADDEFTVEGQRLMADYPNLDTIVASREFQEFAARTPSRQRDFVTAAQGEGLEQVRAARRLLEDFNDFSSSEQPAPSAEPSTPAPAAAPQPGVAEARAVANEGAGPAGAVSTKPLMYEADVINLIHTDRAKYNSPSFQAELMEAIREGRYVKQ